MKSVNKFYHGAVINFLLIAFKVGCGLSTIGLIFYIFLGVLEFFIGESAIPKNFPVMFSLEHTGIVNLSEQSSVANLSMGRAMGIITAEDLPQSFIVIYRIIFVLRLSCFLWSLKLTIDILKAVKQGCFLIIKNAIRLQRIAFLGIGMYLFGALATYTSSSYLSNLLQFPGLEFTSINSYIFFDVQTLFYSLFLLVISEAFRIGALLKQEADLTI